METYLETPPSTALLAQAPCNSVLSRLNVLTSETWVWVSGSSPASVKFAGLFRGSGQPSRVGSGRVGWGQLTRPDPRKFDVFDSIRLDPRDFESIWTTDPTRPAKI